jgi:hypothetical protein
MAASEAVLSRQSAKPPATHLHIRLRPPISHFWGRLVLVTRAVARCGPETKQVRKVNRKSSDNIEVEYIVLIRHRKGTHIYPRIS